MEFKFQQCIILVISPLEMKINTNESKTKAVDNFTSAIIIARERINYKKELNALTAFLQRRHIKFKSPLRP